MVAEEEVEAVMVMVSYRKNLNFRFFLNFFKKINCFLGGGGHGGGGHGGGGHGGGGHGGGGGGGGGYSVVHLLVPAGGGGKN